MFCAAFFSGGVENGLLSDIFLSRRKKSKLRLFETERISFLEFSKRWALKSPKKVEGDDITARFGLSHLNGC